MYVMKIYEAQDGIFKNTEDAIQYMIENNFQKEVSVYDVNSDKAYKKINEIYSVIKEYNKGKPLDDQILPTNPFGYRGIVECLGVKVYSIDIGTYKHNHELLALFTGFNDYVLDISVEKANVKPGLKAMASLAMIRGML